MKHSWWIVVAALAAAQVEAYAEPKVDTHPRVDPKPSDEVSPGVVELVGQIVVMQGDDEIVTTLGGGDFGIDVEAQMPNIGQRFYLTYGDDFDGLAVFTTFPDLLQGGAAYSVSPGWSGVEGLGLSTGSGAGAYGSAGRLISVINMNDTDSYSSMTESDIWFLSTFGQEFAHTWLSFMQFVDPMTGTPSNELLGRDGSHWSAIFDSGSSVMDGVTFTDNGNGTFTAGPFATRYGPLDLYAMGVIGPEEVGPLYVIRNASYQDSGAAVDPVNDGWTGQMSEGRVVTGDRFDFTIDDVVAAHGERRPAWDADNDDFRVAFILVTRPGETVADVMDRVNKLEVGRLAWETAHREWTMNRSTMCTDIGAACPLSFAAIDSARVEEDPDDSDGDGIIEPGESARLVVVFANEGREPATTAVATLSTESPGVVLPEPETLPEIPVEGTLEHAFSFEIDGEACGTEIEIAVRTQIEQRFWSTSASFLPGALPASEPETFATDAGWTPNRDGLDVVTTGAWEHGVPEATFFAGRTLQPDGGADGADDAAWFTGPFGAWDDGEVEGTTTLTSVPIDLSELFAPTLEYKVWYLALDRTINSLTPSPDAHLIVEASGDGGTTWVEIDRVSGEPKRWELRQASLAGKVEPGPGVRVRFTVIDDRDATERLVEVGIDDVAFSSLSDSCRAGAGGGCCSVGGRGPREHAGMLLLIALALGGALRRRNN